VGHVATRASDEATARTRVYVLREGDDRVMSEGSDDALEDLVCTLRADQCFETSIGAVNEPKVPCPVTTPAVRAHRREPPDADRS